MGYLLKARLQVQGFGLSWFSGLGSQNLWFRLEGSSFKAGEVRTEQFAGEGNTDVKLDA